jgi:hypothetical protein
VDEVKTTQDAVSAEALVVAVRPPATSRPATTAATATSLAIRRRFGILRCAPGTASSRLVAALINGRLKLEVRMRQRTPSRAH